MSSSKIHDQTLREAADVLQQQLIYNGEVLDVAIESLKQYRPGTQSLAYLDASVHMAYALLRMLESWSKNKGASTYVRQKISKKRQKKKGLSIVSLPFPIGLIEFLKVYRKKRASLTSRKKNPKRKKSLTKRFLLLRPSKP